MSKQNHIPMFLAGVGIGVAATLLFTDEETRSRLSHRLRNGWKGVSEALADPAQMWSRAEQAMNQVEDKLKDKLNDKLKDKLKDKFDTASVAGKHLVDHLADHSIQAAHKAGEQLERGGKRLQRA
jgi:gas vesicle protein